MTWSKSVTIWCDEDGCSEWYNGGDPTALQTRKWARKNGWKTGVSGGKDYCPKHSGGD